MWSNSGHTKGVITDVGSEAPLVQANVRLYEQLCLKLAKETNRFLVVTSPARNDGRTSVAANLALCCAQIGGQRTLLIDADFSRPTLPRVFSLKKTKGGMADVLGNGEKWREHLHTFHDGLLSLLPAGKVSFAGLMSKKAEQIGELFDQWKKEFDWIIADTPPILESANALVLGRQATGALLVVRAGRTRAEVVQTAVKKIRDESVSLVGTILNSRQYVIPKYAYRRL